MEKRLSVKKFVIDTLSFMTHNLLLLFLFGFCSFSASFLSIKYVAHHQQMMLFLYSVFCYFFYYIFICLYYDQKPLFSNEKLVNSFLKLVVIFAFSLFVIICGHLCTAILKYLSHRLIGFPDIYQVLKSTYIFLNANKVGQFFLYCGIIFLLTFTFFIPGFSFISTLNGADSSTLTAYVKTHGNYIKIAVILIFLYAFCPFMMSFVTRQKLFDLSLSHAIMTILQLSFYVRLYDFFYDEQEG